MSEADDGAMIFDQIMIRTISRHFATPGSELPAIRRDMKRARTVIAMEQADRLRSLGINPSELAGGIIKSLDRKASRATKPWHERNHWNAQHPFVGRVPVVGALFEVDRHPQFGSGAAIRAERPDHGPSMRLLWQPSDPKSSLWAFPTGLSGHVLSPHFKDWSLYWQQGALVSVPVSP
jgi:acyl-homoserine lactone acylase PvdQ